MRKLFCVFAFVISATTSFAAHCDDSSLRSDTLVVVGILREAELADGHGITVLISGADPVQLKEDLAAQDLTDVRAIFSFGLAGGLNPTYRTGDIVVPSAIIFGGQRWSTDRIIRENLIVQLRLKGMRVHESVLLGSNEIILTTRHKSDLHHFLRADAVDMESHVAAEFAAEHDIPFVVIRAVSDASDSALPVAVLNSVAPNGTINLFSILRKVWTDPIQILELIQAGQDSKKAFAALGKCQDFLR